MADARAWLLVAPGDQDVPDGLVLLQITQAVAVHPENLLPLRLVHTRGRHVVVRTLDDELGRPAGGNLVVQAHALAPDLVLDHEVRIDLGHDAHAPAGAVGR